MFRALVLIAGLSLALGAAELTVGPGKMYAKPSLAAAACRDGDTISIDAGTYAGDVATWSRNDLTIRGVGGYAHLEAPASISNRKAIWVITGANATVERIAFSGAAVPDKNGAGIRQEGTHLTVRDCRFLDNENGILSGADSGSDIVIEGSEFARNGHGDGYSHNLYIGKVRSLTFRWNYSHHTRIGHNLKSRAMTNIIVGNRIMDEDSGTSSYVVDIPNGGRTWLIGNLIQQGRSSSNRYFIVRHGEEGATNPEQRLYAVNNTIVNDHASATTFIDVAAGTAFTACNNILLGAGTAWSRAPATAQGNLITNVDPLLSRATYDYRLAPGSAAIDAGADPGSGDGMALLPDRQYVHPRSSEARATAGTAPDAGAYEADDGDGGGADNEAPSVDAASASPAAVTAGTATVLAASASDDGGEPALRYAWSASGPAAVAFSRNGANAARSTTATFAAAGTYDFTVTARDAGGLSGSGTVRVVVSAAASALEIVPAVATVEPGQEALFAAIVRDQFGNAMADRPALTWSADGGGSIDADGGFAAGASPGGPYAVTAVGGGLSGSARVIVLSEARIADDARTGTADGGACGAGTAGLALLAGLPLLRRRRR